MSSSNSFSSAGSNSTDKFKDWVSLHRHLITQCSKELDVAHDHKWRMTYCWGLCGRCLGWWDRWWPRGLAQSGAHACAASLERWLYTVQTYHDRKKHVSSCVCVYLLTWNRETAGWGYLPMLIKRICDEFWVKGDVRQAVAVFDPTNYSWPVMSRNVEDKSSHFHIP